MTLDRMISGEEEESQTAEGWKTMGYSLKKLTLTKERNWAMAKKDVGLRRDSPPLFKNKKMYYFK